MPAPAWVAFLAVLGAIGGLYYTSRTFRLSRDAQIAARKYAEETTRLGVDTLHLSERGQITDRYSKAVEMLGDSSHEICVGGIYALGHIMIDSPDYEPAIVAVLSAFIRRKAKRRDDLAVPWGVDEAERDEVKPSFPIQAALNVFVNSRPSGTPPDLRDSDLRGARLRSAQLQGANFRRTYLHKAKLYGANLGGATLTKADLTEADLAHANLQNADLKGARLAVGALTQEQLKTVRNADKIVWVPTMSDSNPDLGSSEDERADPL
jgi:hypothetical protein